LSKSSFAGGVWYDMVCLIFLVLVIWVHWVFDTNSFV
jgi:hypothetical protein